MLLLKGGGGVKHDPLEVGFDSLVVRLHLMIECIVIVMLGCCLFDIDTTSPFLSMSFILGEDK